ncbi:MAG: hypothetical protein QOG06_1751 [Gaiellaceae bacterium]|jgi:hypothetical protein|nr:hypothetical protein [Gaiellaceae bacterium]
MIRLTLAAAVLVALALPTLAAAKEPTQASISGPGFHKALSLPDGADFSSTPIGRLTTDSGFFPSAVGQSPDPMLHARPARPLGLRYRIVWTVPGGGPTRRVTQDVYPYAHGGALAYMRPGQRIYGATTTGGWYPGGLALKQALVQLGLPKAPRPSAGTNYALVAGLGIPGVLVALGVAALFARRRAQRGERSPSTSSTELPAGQRT